MPDSIPDQVFLAAHLYYNDGLDQPSIARYLQLSQAHVSRLLLEARKRGVVQISVAPYNARLEELELRIAERLGLRSVFVFKLMKPDLAKKDETSVHEEIRNSLAYFARSAVLDLFDEGGTVTVGNGRLLSTLVRGLPAAASTRPITVIQGTGNIDSNVAEYDSAEIGRNLARKWNGQFLTLNAPVIVPDRAMRDALLGVGQIRMVKERLKTADAALIGVGTPEINVYFELVKRGDLTEADFADLKRAGAVAEICGRYIDAEGNECETSLRDRTVGIEIDDLRKIPNVVCIADGGQRSRAILAALKGGIANSLIVDEIGARNLLEECESQPKPRKKKTKPTA